MEKNRNHPLDFHFQDRELVIQWADAARGAISFVELRRQCPCSACRAEREQVRANPLRVLPTGTHPDDMTAVQNAELAGSYALRITWRDGHNTGIYNFELLRAIFDQTRKSVRSDKNVDS